LAIQGLAQLPTHRRAHPDGDGRRDERAGHPDLGTADKFSRNIGNIKAGYVVKKNGSTLTGGGVNYTLNTTTGAITGLSALSGGDLITVTLEFYIKVRFEQDMLAPSIQYFNTARIDSISAIELLS
jgi:hypothetical protein